MTNQQIINRLKVAMDIVKDCERDYELGKCDMELMYYRQAGFMQHIIEFILENQDKKVEY